MEQRVRVKYGGGLSRWIKSEEEWVKISSGETLAGLLSKIYGRFESPPGDHSTKKNGAFLLTFNGRFLSPTESKDITLRGGDTIHLFPPVSGG